MRKDILGGIETAATDDGPKREKGLVCSKAATYYNARIMGDAVQRDREGIIN